MRNKWILIYSCLTVLAVYLLFAVCTDKGVRVIMENKVLPPVNTVIIDAGHGGEDGGATSCCGFLESDINLEISLRLNDLLNFLGHRTIMVRTEDVSVHTEGQTIAQRKVSDLKNRVQLVNETENALLVSIHQNYFADSRYSGAQVFCADSAGSRKLAEEIQKSFHDTINPDSKRMVKAAQNIYLMNEIRRDGVLIECGFLSNYQEEQKLRDLEYQKKICAVIASSVCTYMQKDPLLT